MVAEFVFKFLQSNKLGECYKEIRGNNGVSFIISLEHSELSFVGNKLIINRRLLFLSLCDYFLKLKISFFSLLKTNVYSSNMDFGRKIGK